MVAKSQPSVSLSDFFLACSLRNIQYRVIIFHSKISKLVNAIPIQYIVSLICRLFNFLTFYLEAILFNFFLTASGLSNRKSFMPAFFFILLGSLYAEWNFAGIHIIGSLLLLLSVFSLFSLTGQEPGKEKIFYTALF